MPVYNEAARIASAVDRVLQLDCLQELVIVDDGSTDGTRRILESLADPRVRLFLQPANQGKGAALRRGFSEARPPMSPCMTQTSNTTHWTW
jgi:glycosyltransferase involved in cell wall biosynthesis